MAFVFAIWFAASMAFLLATGGGPRDNTGDFGIFFTAAAIVLALALGLEGVRLRRGLPVRAQTYVLGAALIATAVELYVTDSIYEGTRGLLAYRMTSVDGIFTMLVHLVFVMLLVVFPVMLLARVVEALTFSPILHGRTAAYSEPSVLDSWSLVSSFAILLIPWIAMVGLASLEDGSLSPSWRRFVGARSTAGFVFSSTFPWVAAGAVLLGYAYDRALGWRQTTLRRALALMSGLALGAAPMILPPLATSSFEIGWLTPNAWGDFEVDRDDRIAPLLAAGAASVGISFVGASMSLLALRRGRRPFPLAATLALLAIALAATRYAVPRFGPVAAPLVAVAAMVPIVGHLLDGLTTRPADAVRE